MANQTQYTVKEGDSLWTLAEKYLDDPNRWREIWHYNNQQYSSPEIRTRLKPSRYIENPDLIFVGQDLLIPTSGNERQTVPPGPSDSGKTPAKKEIPMIPYKFELTKKVFETMLPGGLRSNITIKGAITIQSDKAVSWAEFNQDGFNVKVAKGYETPLNKLVSEFQLGLNESTKQIDFSCGVTMHSGAPYATKHQAMVSVNPLTGMPTYKTTITYPEIRGKLNEHFYCATGYSVEINIEKLPDGRRHMPIPITVPQRVPAKAPARSGGRGWAYAAGALLLVGTAAVVVGTIAENFVTGGAGVADDPACFALAASMTTRAIQLFRGAQVTVRLGGAAFAH